MKEVERINKSVLTADSIETTRGWSLAQKDNPVLCSYCKSPLFYVGIEWGVVEEKELWGNIKVLGRERKFQYMLRKVGLNLYCAECGHFHNDYQKYFYPKEKAVCSWNDEELDYAEIEEIQYCLEQFNRKGDFTPIYKNPEMIYLKRKLKEYEEKLQETKRQRQGKKKSKKRDKSKKKGKK